MSNFFGLSADSSRNSILRALEVWEKSSIARTFLYIYKDPEFFKKFKKHEKNDFFEKSPKTEKIIFFDFFQDFQNSSSVFWKNQKQFFKQ